MKNDLKMRKELRNGKKWMSRMGYWRNEQKVIQTTRTMEFKSEEKENERKEDRQIKVEINEMGSIDGKETKRGKTNEWILELINQPTNQPTMIGNDQIEKTRKLMETNENQLKMDGNERNRGDLRIHMKVQ